MDSATAEEVLLDENREAEGHKCFDLGGFQASAVFLHCHRLFCILLSSASQKTEFLCYSSQKQSWYHYLMCAQVSADHRHLAYAVDFSGNETYSIYVKDMAEDTVEHVSGVHDASGQLAWGLDNGTLFYTTVVSSSLVCTLSLMSNMQRALTPVSTENPTFAVMPNAGIQSSKSSPV